jgi:KaiC
MAADHQIARSTRRVTRGGRPWARSGGCDSVVTGQLESRRLPSGHHRLDAILAGGLYANSLSLITGAPGSGKTILAQQFVFANASEDRPALYVSTVSEPMDKILRFGRTLSFFDDTAVGRSAFYQDFGNLLNERGLPGVVDRLGDQIDELAPGMIVIDSFNALHAFARTPEDFRWFSTTWPPGWAPARPRRCGWASTAGRTSPASRRSRSPTRSCLCRRSRRPSGKCGAADPQVAG